MGLAGRHVPRARAQRASESRHQRLLQHARAEWLELVGVERAEAREDLIGIGQPVIHTEAELIDVFDLLPDGGQISPDAGRGRHRHVLQKGRGDGIDARSGNPVVRKWRADTGRRSGSYRIAEGWKPGEVAAAELERRHREGPRQRSVGASTLVAEKGEGPVPKQGAADRAAELMLTERRHRCVLRIEVVVRVEPVVAQEFEDAPVRRVAARLRGHVDQRRRLSAKLGGVHRLLDLEFLNRVDRRIDHQVVEQLVGDLRAVQQVNVVSRSLPSDVWQRPGLLQRVAASAPGRQHH